MKNLDLRCTLMKQRLIEEAIKYRESKKHFDNRINDIEEITCKQLLRSPELAPYTKISIGYLINHTKNISEYHKRKLKIMVEVIEEVFNA